MPPKELIIPVETKARELHGKLLLAICASDLGFRVTFGDQRIIAGSLHRIRPGIYLDKSVVRTKIAHYRRLKALGFSIAAWCEEGLVYRDKAAYQFERISPEAMELADLFFAWGEVHANDMLEVVPWAKDKILAYGNPRFDLLQEPYRSIIASEAAELVEQHGDYILIVTTFSRFNKHESRDDVLGVLKARGFELTPEQVAHYRSLLEHLGQVFGAFTELALELAQAFPDKKIIVRPHPSENHDRWRDVVAGVDNAEVIYEGSVEPWILGSNAVIHNASTTGIGAYLLDHPTISYMPVIHPVFNRVSHLPNLLSARPTTPEDVIARIKQIEAGAKASTRREKEKRDAAALTVANAFSPTASDRIAEALSELWDRDLPGTSGQLRPSGARLFIAARNKAAKLRGLLRKASPLHAYMDQKFPGLTIGEIQTSLEKLSGARGQGPAPSVRPHPDLPSCFLITSGGENGQS